jgi:hypothetical protein
MLMTPMRMLMTPMRMLMMLMTPMKPNKSRRGGSQRGGRC